MLKNPSSSRWVAIAQPEAEASEQQREAYKREQDADDEGDRAFLRRGMTAALSRSTARWRYPERTDDPDIADLCVVTT